MESRLDEISMQKTVIHGTLQRFNSLNSEVDSIHEIDKLYSNEEQIINKLSGKIILKSAGMDREIEEKIPDSIDEFLNLKDKFSKHVEKIEKIHGMVNSSQLNLMNFLENPEADAPLEDVNNDSSDSLDRQDSFKIPAAFGNEKLRSRQNSKRKLEKSMLDEIAETNENKADDGMVSGEKLKLKKRKSIFFEGSNEDEKNKNDGTGLETTRVS